MPYLDKKEFANYLLGWDEKHTDYLKHIYSENINKQNFIKLVTDLFLEDKGLELSTSWLIKYHFDMKETLKNEDIKSVLLNLKNLYLLKKNLNSFCFLILEILDVSKSQTHY